MRALELFAGIGGLRLALPPGLEVVAAIDQDEAAQRTYLANHPGPALRLDLGTVRAATLAGFAAEAWVLSPPCQPFTRRGRRRDVDDPRCAALLRLVELLPDLAPRRLLVENVVGFAASRACARLVAALDRAGLEWRIEELCPSALGWPIRRPRQYLLASRDGLPPAGPVDAAPAPELTALLDPEPDPALYVPPGRVGRYAGRALRPGAALATITRSYLKPVAGSGPLIEDGHGLRFLSPREILRLHGFPPAFRFPEGLTLRACMRLAGNTVHVAAVRAAARALAPHPAASGAGRRS